MKRIILLTLSTIGILFGTVVLGGFDKEKKILLNLDLNEYYMNLISEKSSELSKGNGEKFGKDILKSKLNIQIYDFQLTEELAKREHYEAKVKGVIKAPTGNFNFEGDGDINKVMLDSNKEIYSGSFKGNVKNIKGDDVVTISFRYNPKTKESDVTVVSGFVGDTGILPFGSPFLYEEDLVEIREIIESRD